MFVGSEAAFESAAVFGSAGQTAFESAAVFEVVIAFEAPSVSEGRFAFAAVFEFEKAPVAFGAVPERFGDLSTGRSLFC